MEPNRAIIQLTANILLNTNQIKRLGWTDNGQMVEPKLMAMAPTQDESRLQQGRRSRMLRYHFWSTPDHRFTGKESFLDAFLPRAIYFTSLSNIFQLPGVTTSPTEHVLSPLKTRNRIRTYPLLAGFHGRWIWVNERTYLLAVLPSHHDAEDGEADGWDRNNGTYAVLDDIVLCCLQLGLQWVNFLHMAARHFGWSPM